MRSEWSGRAAKHSASKNLLNTPPKFSENVFPTRMTIVKRGDQQRIAQIGLTQTDVVLRHLQKLRGGYCDMKNVLILEKKRKMQPNKFLLWRNFL